MYNWNWLIHHHFPTNIHQIWSIQLRKSSFSNQFNLIIINWLIQMIQDSDSEWFTCHRSSASLAISTRNVRWQRELPFAAPVSALSSSLRSPNSSSKITIGEALFWSSLQSLWTASYLVPFSVHWNRRIRKEMMKRTNAVSKISLIGIYWQIHSSSSSLYRISWPWSDTMCPTFTSKYNSFEIVQIGIIILKINCF